MVTDPRTTAQTVPASAPAPAVRLAFMDGLRGFAIFMVMLRHYYMAAYDRGFPRWADIFGIEVGVQLFLILSGFGLAWSYIGPRQRPFSATDFFLRRAARILPSYYVALFISLLLVRDLPLGHWLFQAVTHITLTHNLFNETVLGVYAPAWSLALEFQFYLLFPVILFSFRRWSVRNTLIAIFFVSLVFRVYAMRFGTQYNEFTFTVQWSALGRLFSFALAMGATTLVARWQKEPPSLSILRALPVVSVLLLLGGVLTRRSLGVTHPVTGLCWDFGFVCVILWCAARTDWLSRVLKFRPLTFVAAMSYSVFLVHGHVLHYVVVPVMQRLPARISPLVIMPFAYLAMIACSWVFYKLVEKPLGDYFYQWRTRIAQKAKSAKPVPEISPS